MDLAGARAGAVHDSIVAVPSKKEEFDAVIKLRNDFQLKIARLDLAGALLCEEQDPESLVWSVRSDNSACC